MRIQKIVFTITGLLISCFVYSQSASYFQKNEYFNKAVDLYEKEMYCSAQEQLIKAKEHINPNDAIMLADIDFYNAMCALKNKQDDAQYLVDKILTSTPKNPNHTATAYEYAKYLFEEEKYKDA